jgi:hypothetical protein
MMCRQGSNVAAGEFWMVLVVGANLFSFTCPIFFQSISINQIFYFNSVWDGFWNSLAGRFEE